MDNKTQIDAILLDFAKAFDKVPHKRLLSKNLLHTGSLATHTTGSHLLYQIVSSESRLMEPCRTSHMLHLVSHPQGSVLGPILFLLYINDINENVQSSVRLSADDSNIYSKINSNIDHQILQTDLSELEKWSDKWQMQFNLSKCVHLPITNKTKHVHTSIRYLDTRFLK